MQKLIYGLLGVLAVGFLWLCGNAISSNLAYDNWIKGLDTNKYIAADERNLFHGLSVPLGRRKGI